MEPDIDDEQLMRLAKQYVVMHDDLAIQQSDLAIQQARLKELGDLVMMELIKRGEYKEI
jgi:hypothetical protein